MSLARFRASNHPQQVGRRGARPGIDDRGTDPALFLMLDREFRFTVDVAASGENAKCVNFYTEADSGLEYSWAGERVWCNPPYSRIEPWVEKAWAEVERAEVIVMLLPANRCEQGWWQRWVEPRRDRPDSPLRVRFLPGRHRFTRAGSHGSPIPPNSRPPFGSCLLIWRTEGGE